MKFTLLSSCLFSILLFSCNSTGPEASSLETPPAESTSTVSAETTQRPPTLSMSELFPPSEAKSITGCNGEPSVRKDDREYRTSVTYSCTDPFSILSIALDWPKDGKPRDLSRMDNNPVLEKVSVPGADAAHLMGAQGRLMVAKGKYLLTVQMPGSELETISLIAEKIIGQL